VPTDYRRPDQVISHRGPARLAGS